MKRANTGIQRNDLTIYKKSDSNEIAYQSPVDHVKYDTIRITYSIPEKPLMVYLFGRGSYRSVKIEIAPTNRHDDIVSYIDGDETTVITYRQGRVYAVEISVRGKYRNKISGDLRVNGRISHFVHNFRGEDAPIISPEAVSELVDVYSQAAKSSFDTVYEYYTRQFQDIINDSSELHTALTSKRSKINPK